MTRGDGRSHLCLFRVRCGWWSVHDHDPSVKGAVHKEREGAVETMAKEALTHRITQLQQLLHSHPSSHPRSVEDLYSHLKGETG